MPLNPGQIDGAGNYVDGDCMARFIEDNLPPAQLPDDPAAQAMVRTEKRRFLIGLSTGIIEYLKAHDQDSFKVAAAGDPNGKLDIL
jgi:hypothetical protein